MTAKIDPRSSPLIQEPPTKRPHNEKDSTISSLGQKNVNKGGLQRSKTVTLDLCKNDLSRNAFSPTNTGRTSPVGLDLEELVERSFLQEKR